MIFVCEKCDKRIKKGFTILITVIEELQNPEFGDYQECHNLHANGNLCMDCFKELNEIIKIKHFPTIKEPQP
jgi:hypothetical protein